MLTHGSILVSLLWLVEQIPTPPPPVKRQRGRQEFYSDKLFVKALLVMIIRRLYTAYALLSFLEQDDPVSQQIRPLLTEHGRFPTRRTWERRFETLPARLPALIGCLGRQLVTLLQPWAAQGHAAAVDSTPLRANGGVWHKKHRLAGEVPHTSIDTEATWSKSGYHGWWYGWKLHLAVVVGSVWIPLAAELTTAVHGVGTCRAKASGGALGCDWVRFRCVKSSCCLNTSDRNPSVSESRPYYERHDLCPRLN